jgi:phenylacetate-CoA ligase
MQAGRLSAMLRAILPVNQFYSRKLGTNGRSLRVRSLDDFRTLPFTTKQELLDDQAANPPYGTDLSLPLDRFCRLHQSSGTAGVPLRWLDTPESWAWFLGCWQTIYDVIGLEPADRLFFPFSFGPFLGFWGAFEGAARRGNLCLSGGGMTTVARLRFMMENRATVVACTPTYAMHMAEVADDEGVDLAGSPVRALIVAGEPGGSVPATRARIESAWGARVFDHTGMTEIGALGIECVQHSGGIHLIETECIAEVIDPHTTKPVRPGDQGELVLTNLGRWGSPLVRYRTGDLVVADSEPCPCGRPWTRLVGGILGRVDDMIVVRGNNIHPAAVEELLRGLAEVGEFRCTFRTRRNMNALAIEVEPAAGQASSDSLARRVARAFQDRFHFRADVSAVRPGTLPRFEMKGRRFVRERSDAE